MKKRLLVAATAALALGALVAPQTGAQGKTVSVKLQLKWFPQSQFAGFFVAKEKGYYKSEGLDVSFLPSGDANPIKAVVGGAADFGTTWITDLLLQRAAGQKVVHIGQFFQKSGFTLVTLKDSGITKLAQLKGKKIGVWPGGNELPIVAALKKNGLTTSLDSSVANPDVTAVTFPFDPALVFPDKVDAVSAMTYNEVNQIIGLGYTQDKINVISLADDEGINLLEDLMFATEKVLADPNFKNSGMSGKQVAAKLLHASIRGWDYAVAHQAEAVKIVLPLCGNTCKGSGSIDAAGHQTWQMKEIAKLYSAGPSTKGMAGLLDPKVYDANVKLLRDLNVLKTDPDKGAVRWDVWELATGKKAPKM